MDFYEVLDRRRFTRRFSDRPVPEDVLERILGTALKAPTNDHLHQLEFVVVRDREKIAEVIAPVAENTARVQERMIAENAGSMDPDELAMFREALPRQHTMLIESGCLVLPFFKQEGCPLTKPADQSSLNYFASAWAAVENILLAAAAESVGTAFRIPIKNESEHAKRVVGAPEGYEFVCFLALGYPAEGPHFCRPKRIDVRDRIHRNEW